LDLIYNQRKRTERYMNLPPDNTVNDLGNFGFDFASVVEASENC
jgi:hypothetical protein